MRFSELAIRLESEGIRSDAYSLNDGGSDESYVILQEQEIWNVYYSERGRRSSLKTYSSESDACEDLLQRILSDESTRR